MKTRKAKAAAKGKIFLSKKKLKGNLPLDVSDSGSDIDDESFFHDEIDDFHKNEEDKLSTDDELIQHKVESSDEEEVLPISGEETDDYEEDNLEDDDGGGGYDDDDSGSGGDDDDDGGSGGDDDDDISDNDEERDLPNRAAWGKKKSTYFGADFIDEDRGRSYREKDQEAADQERDEAVTVQQSLYQIIGSLGLRNEKPSLEKEGEKNDSKSEKLKHVKKSTDILNMFGDFKASMQEIHDKLVPLLNLASKGKLPLEEWMNYIKLKYHLLLHYSLNLSFYLMLKSSNMQMKYHPVLERISSYKKLLDTVKVIDKATKDDIDTIIEKAKENEEFTFYQSQLQDIKEGKLLQSVTNNSVETPLKDHGSKTKKSKRKLVETEAEKEILSFIQDVKEGVKKRKTEKYDKDLSSDEPESKDVQNDEEAVDPSREKRTISYQIAKNKGLVPHRKKEYRNPRVLHREKYRKAKIRRKGQVRNVVKEIRRYEGEPTGISTHVVRSVKLK